MEKDNLKEIKDMLNNANATLTVRKLLIALILAYLLKGVLIALCIGVVWLFVGIFIPLIPYPFIPIMLIGAAAAFVIELIQAVIEIAKRAKEEKNADD